MDRGGSSPAVSVLVARRLGPLSMLVLGFHGFWLARRAGWSVKLFQKGGRVYFWYHTFYRSCPSLQELGCPPCATIFTASALFPCFSSLFFWVSNGVLEDHIFTLSALCGASLS